MATAIASSEGHRSSSRGKGIYGVPKPLSNGFFVLTIGRCPEKLTPSLASGESVLRKNELNIALLPMSTPKELQRVELLNYTKANGEELIGLAVELAEDPSGGVQVRVLMDSNVVSGVTVVPLQQGGCCD